MKSAPVLYRCREGMICGPHRTAAGQSVFHTPGCFRCEAIRAKDIAEGRTLKPNATDFTKHQRMCLQYRDNMTGRATPEQIEAARARGFRAMGLTR
jgi:hypothetical protein